MTSKKVRPHGQEKKQQRTWLSDGEICAIDKGTGRGGYSAEGGDIPDDVKTKLEKLAELFGRTPAWKKDSQSGQGTENRG